jgi:hypothetical protein
MQTTVAQQLQFIKQLMKELNDFVEEVESRPNSKGENTLDLETAEDYKIRYKALNDIASTLAAVRFTESPISDKTVSYELMFGFMKWFIHESRKNLKYDDNVNAVEYASNLMSKLCAVPAFGESVMENEFKKFLESLKETV